MNSHPNAKKYHTICLCILGALVALWCMRPVACGKEVKTVNFCAVPVNHTATVQQSPFSIVLRPFQKEQAQIVYTDGSTDPWKDTSKTGSTIDVFILNEETPYTLYDCILPGFAGSDQNTWPDMNVDITVTLQNQ